MKDMRLPPAVLIAVLLSAALLVAACVTPTAPEGASDGSTTGLYARVVTVANPVRLEMARDAPIVGLLWHGMRLPVTGRNMTCEWLKVMLPLSLSHFGAEGWIVGPPEFALIEGGGCAGIPLEMPVPTPAG